MKYLLYYLNRQSGNKIDASLVYVCVSLSGWVDGWSTAAEGGLLSAPALLVLLHQPEPCYGTTALWPSYPHLQAEEQGSGFMEHRNYNNST